ncbi:BgTH12-03456 [Blumeria graminis f. sp. triticale]|uniref:Bgt-3264 n=3 Tax=Blumeria graminis TaxID=34373 RepID=A0A9X9PR05_BLUGR|nr:hypothetical protein BGT96224_3264 [Blumeria graminis f. sp. tritici 96224]CAD6499336.1 BgTH12-03456 [Blumeria graminis f. sp. triticale]VCU39460.1 Bgt-3264 [Blumeria graminis f. sp. tritici]
MEENHPGIKWSSTATHRKNNTPYELSSLHHRSVGIHENDGDDASQFNKRRSSTLSDYSMKDVRNVIQTSTDELLLPKLDSTKIEHIQRSSAWHSAPLAFALLPALGGIFFTNGSGFVTDILLLGLAAIFLNWSVRLPWDWYHAARYIQYSDDDSIGVLPIPEDDKNKEISQSATSMGHVHGEEPEKPQATDNKQLKRNDAYEYAASELSRRESLALLSCFLFPLIGTYLLHALRSQLNRPKEGLISDYNLTIFLLASELRPIVHVMKLIQARTLHLQRVVSSKPYRKDVTLKTIKEISRRLEEVEARNLTLHKTSSEFTVIEKQLNLISSEIRKSLHSEIDTLNRAVRRYEKRASIQTIQTESRLQELESRLQDTISIAAIAAKATTSQRIHTHQLTTAIIKWAATTLIFPFQAFNSLVRLPGKFMISSTQVGKYMMPQQEKPVEKITKGMNVKKSFSRSSHLMEGEGKSFND